jgi:acetylornithine deacetylase
VLASAGVPSVVFGPGSIAQAHTADEWIALDQVAAAAVILVDCVETPVATGTQKPAVTS